MPVQQPIKIVAKPHDALLHRTVSFFPIAVHSAYHINCFLSLAIPWLERYGLWNGGSSVSRLIGQIWPEAFPFDLFFSNQRLPCHCYLWSGDFLAPEKPTYYCCLLPGAKSVAWRQEIRDVYGILPQP